MRNTVIEGDLILGEGIGEGEVYLHGVTVKGQTIVNGGGTESIYFTDSVLATVIVNKNTGAVRIVAKGSTQVYEVQLETPTIVREEGLDANASGFEDVIISEAMQSVGEGYHVQLEGEFETINSRATNIRIDLAAETDIRTLALNAAAQVLGTGIIRTAVINADGSTISQRPQNVVLNISGGVTVDNETITDSYSDESVESTTIQSITAQQGSISLEMENFVAGLNVSDFTVSANVDGEDYALHNLNYQPNQNRITFDPIEIGDNIGKTANITVTPNSSKVTGGAKTASFELGTGFAGRLTDIQGVGAQGVTIKFREGTGATGGNVVGVVTTDSYGYYSVNLPAGTYTGEVSGPGYVTTYINGVAASDVFLTDQNETIIRAAASNEVKIMLSWGERPWDVDSHLTGPTVEGSLFHIAYYNKEEVKNGITYVDLDWDDTDSYGPETTTIRKLLDGEYRFYLHNFSGDHPLRQSQSKVEIFKGNANVPAATFEVPTGEGDERYWVVFDLIVSNNGESFEIKPVNTMVGEETLMVSINGQPIEYQEFVTPGSLLELSASEGTEIRYEINTDDYWIEADINSPLYTSPIEITDKMNINIALIKEGIIVGREEHYFDIASLEIAKQLVEELEAMDLTDENAVYNSWSVHDRAKRIVESLPSSAETQDLLTRLDIVRAAIDEAYSQLSY
ncbi:hypothetical protein MKZ25_03145 [Solibacillus sp. FSL W7-1464]|uniref:hypothetical protein n=1 Tax=Solibacillus sp. FSL W7-1464 TaxID=2921706 RepID=UPI0030F96ED6